MLPSLHRLALRAPIGAPCHHEEMEDSDSDLDEVGDRSKTRLPKAARTTSSSDRASQIAFALKVNVRNAIASMGYDVVRVCEWLKNELENELATLAKPSAPSDDQGSGPYDDNDSTWREAFAYCTGLADSILKTRRMTIPAKGPNEFDPLVRPSGVLNIPVRPDNWKEAFQRLCNGIKAFNVHWIDARTRIRWADLHFPPGEERSWTPFELDYVTHKLLEIGGPILRAVLLARGGSSDRYRLGVNKAKVFINLVERERFAEAADMLNVPKGPLYFRPPPLPDSGEARRSVVRVLVNKLLLGIDTVALLERVVKEHGADVNHPTGRGPTPLEHAVDWRDRYVVDLLLRLKADPSRGSPLVTAILKLMSAPAGDGTNERYIFERLLEEGADVDQARADGETALIAAVRRGRPDLVRLLLERGADPRKAGGRGDAFQNVDSLMSWNLEAYRQICRLLDLDGDDGDGAEE